MMRRALELARRAWGYTHPNPMVGALIVENGQIVAEGWHERSGADHAEVAALKALGRKPAPGASLVVTLEPCCTHGRTGACTGAILEAGLARVIVGTTDPNPAHAGRGLQILREAGVEVQSGVLEAECRDLNLIFNHHIVKQRPLLAGKVATTLDGKVATREAHARWITGAGSRADVMHWRAYFPAIAVGSGTALHDDPALTIRLPGQAIRSPQRFVFDRRLAMADMPRAQLFTDAHREQTTLVTSDQADPERLARCTRAGIAVWALPTTNSATFLQAFVQRCADEGITGLYIEGGPRLLSAFLAADLLDYLFAYRAPCFLADETAPDCLHGQSPLRMDDAFRLHDIHHARLGDDQLLRGFLRPSLKPQS